MHFTVVFESHQTYDLSYSLVFIPVPVWKKGNKQIINLHRDWPHYMRGDLTPLMQLEDVEKYLAEGRRNAVVVVHATGHATLEDLNTLEADLVEAGFTVSKVSFT